LDLKDILGVVSQLKEHKKCKVVLIFNEGSINDKLYSEYKEKVIDRELTFNPSPDECTNLILADDDEVSKKIKNYCEKLKINNIRLIKKVHTLSKELVALTEKFEPEILDQTLSSLALFTSVIYGNKKEEFPTVGYILNHYPFYDRAIMQTTEKDNNKFDRWGQFLDEYCYGKANKLDLQILHLVEHGYVDKKKFLEEAEEINKEIQSDNKAQFLEEAWELFHESFEDNTDQVVEKLYSATDKNINKISLGNLDSSVHLLRELGKKDLADKLINKCIKERTDTQFFDVDEFMFKERLRDGELKKRFLEEFLRRKVEESGTLTDVLEKIRIGSCSWNEYNEEVLAKASEGDLYQLFKANKGKKLSGYIYACLKFRSPNSTERQKGIISKVENVLRLIAKESDLNALRLTRYNIC
jgi:hypothetical protein